MGRPPSKAARAKLLRATTEILVEEGIGAVSIEAVARRAGVAKTTLYRHFGGIDGLVFAAATASVSETVGPDTGSLIGDLREIQRNYLDIASSPINREVFAWMLTRAMHSLEAAALFRQERIQPRGPTVVALQRAIARGELPPTTNVELAMHIIQGPLISKRFVENSDLTDDEFETLLEMTVRALVDTTAGRPPL
ncbi:TetR/AcrR family transcriptional regulator [Iamia sp.]|uniref:TetR/AcrR family transcriptional regulator n=1 Tax=Iamia sp. TaxID=2722710 RepID=UPI002CF120EF|nr:TetR/AcrR family transcriptional regulator [Iamia sp.]HXH55800.1 TetR/AcrR family transcriptional regulator [Iamia sp.]